MKSALKFFLLAFSLTSCATLSNQSLKPIPFSEIEKLELGKSTKDQVFGLFGKPNKISPHTNTQEAWIYDGVLSTGVIVQKASFSFDANTLIGVFWIPYETDALQEIKAVQEHFKDVKFSKKVKGWDKQGHSYSDDVSYWDTEKGIAFTENGNRHTVDWIIMAVPSLKRGVSSEKTK
jgi:hypothetical protein